MSYFAIQIMNNWLLDMAGKQAKILSVGDVNDLPAAPGIRFAIE
jgi:hypothetical protein